MWTGIWGNFWGLLKHVKYPFEFQEGTWAVLEKLQRKRASSSVQGRISWFAWSCGGKVRVPLELRVDLGDLLVSPQGSQISLALQRAPRESSSIAAGMNRASSLVEAGTSVFFSISDIDLRDSEDLEQGSQASTCIEARNSSCLSSFSWGVRPLVELYLAPAAFSGG